MPLNRTPPPVTPENYATPTTSQQPKKRKASDPMESNNPDNCTVSDLAKIMMDFRAEVKTSSDKQLDEIHDLRTDVNKKFDSIEKDMTTTKSLVKKNTTDIDYLKRRINQADQDKLAAHMEITGIDKKIIENAKQDLKKLTIDVITSFKIPIDPMAINHVYTKEIKKPNFSKHVIIVVFSSVEQKVVVMQKKREATETRQIYFDHQLTPLTRALLMEAKKTAKAIGAKSAYIRSGRVVIAKDDTTKVKVDTFEDLVKLQETE